MTEAGWERYRKDFQRLEVGPRAELELLLDDVDAEILAAEEADDAEARAAFGWLREKIWAKLEEQTPASQVKAEQAIIARHLAVPRYRMGHLRRGASFTIRTRLPRARRRGAGRPGGPRRRRGSTARSGQDPGPSDLDEPPPPGRRRPGHHRPPDRRRRR